MKKNFFTVGQAAKKACMTNETLRHYDRIGLVKPSYKDDQTNYRYYTEQDIVRLNTVQALQQMDLPLQEIRRILEYDDLEKIIDFLTMAEEKADMKIASLKYAKSKIQLAKADYEKKLQGARKARGEFLKDFPQRVIMLSDTLEAPSLNNLWNYLHHFYDRLPPALKDEFVFEDLAGIYTQGEFSRLFAVCVQYKQIEGLQTLPAGKYLCADCTAEDRDKTLQELVKRAYEIYGVSPSFIIQQIVITGILQWDYQIQIPI